MKRDSYSGILSRVRESEGSVDEVPQNVSTDTARQGLFNLLKETLPEEEVEVYFDPRVERSEVIIITYQGVSFEIRA